MGPGARPRAALEPTRDDAPGERRAHLHGLPPQRGARGAPRRRGRRARARAAARPLREGELRPRRRRPRRQGEGRAQRAWQRHVRRPHEHDHRARHPARAPGRERADHAARHPEPGGADRGEHRGGHGGLLARPRRAVGLPVQRGAGDREPDRYELPWDDRPRRLGARERGADGGRQRRAGSVRALPRRLPGPGQLRLGIRRQQRLGARPGARLAQRLPEPQRPLDRSGGAGQG